ncbi:MAG: hypothetical protein IIX84_00795, partial [Oscillospiraceae bacterium]|nr:hypothetical protein [Oscillospiraceae bacterium]
MKNDLKKLFLKLKYLLKGNLLKICLFAFGGILVIAIAGAAIACFAGRGSTPNEPPSLEQTTSEAEQTTSEPPQTTTDPTTAATTPLSTETTPITTEGI